MSKRGGSIPPRYACFLKHDRKEAEPWTKTLIWK